MTLESRTVWNGIVDVFELRGHPKAPKVYAWAHDKEDRKKQRKDVNLLYHGPVMSAVLAVRAAIVQEFRFGEEN